MFPNKSAVQDPAKGNAKSIEQASEDKLQGLVEENGNVKLFDVVSALNPNLYNSRFHRLQPPIW